MLSSKMPPGWPEVADHLHECMHGERCFIVASLDPNELESERVLVQSSVYGPDDAILTLYKELSQHPAVKRVLSEFMLSHANDPEGPSLADRIADGISTWIDNNKPAGHEPM